MGISGSAVSHLSEDVARQVGTISQFVKDIGIPKTRANRIQQFASILGKHIDDGRLDSSKVGYVKRRIYDSSHQIGDAMKSQYGALGIVQKDSLSGIVSGPHHNFQIGDAREVQEALYGVGQQAVSKYRTLIA